MPSFHRKIRTIQRNKPYIGKTFPEKAEMFSLQNKDFNYLKKCSKLENTKNMIHERNNS